MTGLAIIMLRGTNPDNEGVVSLPPRDGCVGGSLYPVLGMCLFCSFWWVCSAEALHNEEQNKNKSQSLLKVLQSLLLLPEQEQFCKNFFSFLHERVTNYK